jgi:DNA polymerase III sliding clamp (beta) subunit (PCNA family)
MGFMIRMPGKIMVPADIFLDGAKLEDAIIFIHIKGYGRARVTHIDVEDRKFNKILAPRHSDYPEVLWNSDTVRIPVKGHELVIVSKILGEIINLDGKLYIRGKGKGIFFGLHKEQIKNIEEYATSLGIPPKKRKKI